MKQIVRLLITFSIFIIILSNTKAQWKDLDIMGIMGNGITVFYKDTIFKGVSHGFYYSPDFGDTWIRNGYVSDAPWKLWINDKKIFVYELDRGLFVSTNRGRTWSGKNQGLIPHSSIDYLEEIDDKIFALTFGGLYVSTNNGDFWEKTTIEKFNDKVQLLKSNDNVLYAISNTGFYSTNDSGKSWSSGQYDTINAPFYQFGISNNKLYVFKKSSILISSDKGLTWIKKEFNILDSAINSAFVEKDMIYVGTKDGVYYSINNGDDWQPMNDGIRNQNINVINKQNDVLFATGQSIYLYCPKTKKWMNIKNQPCGSPAILGKYVFSGMKRASMSDFGILIK